MNKDKIKQMRMIAGYVEDLLDNVPASELRTIKDAVHSLHKVADYYDDPVKLVKQRFDNPNIDCRIEGNELVFRPDFSNQIGIYNFLWSLETILDFIRGYHWTNDRIDIEVIDSINVDDVVVDFENKEVRIDADYYVSLL